MSEVGEELADRLRAHIRDVPDFPRPGIDFKDITPLLADHATFSATVDALAAPHRGSAIDVVAGIEARGFVLGAPVALILGAGFAPVRKKGKLPGSTVEASYDLEYGSATLEVTSDAFAPAARVLVIDDVLATGGTAAATVDLVRRCGAEVIGVSVLLELGFLDGRAALVAVGVEDPHALLTF
ncbi:MAG: adenine phosphoribosyltransferase [Sporichthyaceae bacterium]|nr:adenine phosphoribosyltransferase [Sporichthyaceae bacterium]